MLCLVLQLLATNGYTHLNHLGLIRGILHFLSVTSPISGFSSHVLLVAIGLGSSDQELSTVTCSSAGHPVKFGQNEKEQVDKASLSPLGGWVCGDIGIY